MGAPMDRRCFVELATGALIAGGLAGCASLVTVPVRPRDGRIRLRLSEHPRLAEPGGALRVQPIGRENPLLVLALAGGGYAALSPVCTHQGCIVEVAGPTLACPCHGSEYDREGEVLAGPAERALTRFPVRVSDEGEIVIELEERSAP